MANYNDWVSDEGLREGWLANWLITERETELGGSCIQLTSKWYECPWPYRRKRKTKAKEKRAEKVNNHIIISCVVSKATVESQSVRACNSSVPAFILLLNIFEDLAEIFGCAIRIQTAVWMIQFCIVKYEKGNLRTLIGAKIWWGNLNICRTPHHFDIL